MSILLVTYDAKGDDDALTRHLGAFRHCRVNDRVWLLETLSSAEAVRNAMLPHLPRHGECLVVKLSHDWAAANAACAEWLGQTARRF